MNTPMRPLSSRVPFAPLAFLALLALHACTPAPAPEPEATTEPEISEAPREPVIEAMTFDPSMRPYELAGPLIPAHIPMISAWDIPQNPLTDPALDGSADGAIIRRGYELFTHTPTEASRLVPSQMACANCHLNAGQRELALPLVGAAGMFPEYNARAGVDFTLEDRIVGCFMRSENAPGDRDDSGTHGDLPATDADEVVALAAYVRWLSRDFTPGEDPPWRKQNRIPDDQLIPVDELDPATGEALFVEHCQQCHGEDGEGVQIADKRAGPLWGPRSWNDGAGAARIYTLAGMIRFMMPYLDPGVLTDREAQEIAAYITSKPRPEYPMKDQDYLTEPLPPDAVYYPRNKGT